MEIALYLVNSILISKDPFEKRHKKKDVYHRAPGA